MCLFDFGDKKNWDVKDAHQQQNKYGFALPLQVYKIFNAVGHLSNVDVLMCKDYRGKPYAQIRLFWWTILIHDLEDLFNLEKQLKDCTLEQSRTFYLQDRLTALRREISEIEEEISQQ